MGAVEVFWRMRGKVRIKYEYRINKKGAESFRTEDPELCRRKLKELNGARPVPIYTMQSRSMRYGGFIVQPSWSPWS